MDAARAIETIRKLIPSDHITVDSKTGVLSAFLIPDQQTAIKLAIDQMIANATQLPALESVAYPLSGASADEIKKQIQGLAPNATVTAAADRILVIARAEDQNRIKASLAALEIVPIEGSKGMKVFEFEPSIAPAVEATLKAFQPKSQIASNKSGSLIVRGSEEDLRIANEVIEIFKRSQSASQLQLRIFPLEQKADSKWLATLQKILPSANAWLGDDGRQLMLLAAKTDITVVESMLPQLMTLLPQPDQRNMQFYLLSKNQLSRRGSLTDLPPNLIGIKIVDGINKQELMVWATSEQHVAFAKLLEELDQPAPALTPTTPKTYPITVQDSALVLQILVAEFPESKITVDTDASTLTVLADDVSHAKIASRIMTFNEQLPKKNVLTLESYSVRGMSVVALQQALAPLLLKARVNVDTVRNRLLVATDAKTHLEISALVNSLSEKPGVEQQQIVIAYPTENAVASQVKIVFDQLALGATCIADDKLKQIVVTGTLETHAIAKAMITQIDRPALAGAPREIRSYDVKKLQATALLPTLQKMWPDMQLSADTTANRIIASGIVKELSQLDAAIERLISAPDGKPQYVKTYAVPAGDMLTLASILSQIAPQAIVSSDIPSRTVTVWAGEDQQARVQQALEQISKTAQAAKEASTYSIKPTQVAAVQASLQSLFPSIGIASVPTTGQLIIVASPEQQKRIAEVIELLVSGPNASERTVKVFRVDPERVELASLLNALQSTLPSLIRLESNPTNNTILAIGTNEELELVTRKVDELQKQLPAPDGLISTVYPLKYATTSGAIAILQPMVPRAVFVRDALTKTLAATAKASDHQKIQEFLKAYDVHTVPANYVVKPTQTSMVQSSLKSLFPLLEITSDPATGQLIVIASPDHQKRVAEVVDLIVSGPNSSERTVKVFKMDPDRVDPTSFVSALQATLPSTIRLETSSRSGSLLAIGTPEELTMVAAKFAQLQQELPPPDASSSVVYPLKYGNTVSALTVLQALAPRATIVQDVASRTIAATARAHEHQRIREFLQTFDQPKVSNRETHVYRLKHASARGLSTILVDLMPDAVIYGSREEGVLIATATPEQHKRIEGIVKDFDFETQNNVTRVFPVKKGTAVSLRAALQGFSLKATATADAATNSLIVTAPSLEMERIAQIVAEVDAGGIFSKETRFYSLTSSEPLPLSRALQESFPKASFAPDTASGGVFAAAAEEDHVAIAKVIAEINSQPSKLPSLRAFVLKNAKAESVAEALQTAFGRRSTAGVSFSRDAKSVFVVGSRQELLVAEQLVEQLDSAKLDNESKRLQLFTLGGVDGKAVTTSIESLFKDESRSVDVRYDALNEQLFVTGTLTQLKLVEDAIKQFAPPPRELEIIQLNSADPMSFKLAADALFQDEPLTSAPLISVDVNQQQVLVRATKNQLESVHKLLKQMGEAQEPSNVPNGTGKLRFVPTHRGSKQLLEDIKQVWPSMRKNPINVVNPEPLGKIDSESPGRINSEPRALAAGFATTQRLTSTQANADAQLAQKELSPIIVVTGDDQWTLASDDTEALDLFTRLVDTLMNPKVTPFATAGNFSVYILRHADAKHLRELLLDLFGSGESSRRSPVSDAIQRVKIVAESRINALIIGGNRADRKIVEELLAVFDSEDLLDTLQQISPSVVQLQAASAKNVASILQDVYKSQLSSGAGREPVRIPEGVSDEVATVLQQINAQQTGPLLTVSVDDSTNSIVLRGPPSLTTEVRTFIEKLDQQSSTSSARRVQVLRLESTNTKNLEKALNLLRSK
ncbi:MAG TPA: secretin N-terminal domain-containing protein [Pirellula sp.]|nr:secretin N-terminal domain-containing protein [Pirellula sp.]